MILQIDTSIREKIYLALRDRKSEKCWEFACPERSRRETKNQTTDLLLAIDGILKNEKLSFKNVKGILVNLGPGSFTGVRVGVTVANTLAWSLNIPITGYHEGRKKEVLGKLLANTEKKFSKIVLPHYNQN